MTTGLQAARRGGFTMIEILVVVVIALLLAAVALPNFSKSLEGTRLRSSARDVVTAHKYARNMAVLKQSRTAVLFDRENRVIEVVAVPSRESFANRTGFLDDRSKRADEEEPLAAPAKDPFGEEDEEGAGAEEPADISTIDSRPLGRGVNIVGFTSDADVREQNGVFWVNYYPSGMSDGFEVRLADEKDRTITITSDRISGGVEVSRER